MSLDHAPNDRICICDSCHNARMEPLRRWIRRLCEDPQFRSKWMKTTGPIDYMAKEWMGAWKKEEKKNP